MNHTPLFQVATPGKKDLILTYGLADDIKSENLIGCRVFVPLGNRTTIAIIIGETTTLPPGRLRNISDILDREPVLVPELFNTAQWMADHYLCTLLEAIKTTLPSGLLVAPKFIVIWKGPELDGLWPLEVLENRPLLRLAQAASGLRRSSIPQLAKMVGKQELRARLRKLEELDLLEIKEKLQLDRYTAATQEWVLLNPEKSIDEVPPKQRARRRLLEYLHSHGGEAAWQRVAEETKINRSILKSLVDLDLIRLERRSLSLVTEGFDPRAVRIAPPLSSEQSLAIEEVRKCLEKREHRTFLLYGAPGSGKTRVYIEILKHCLSLGRGAILLVPEIALTPQVITRIENAIHEPVALLHSILTTSQRLAGWREIHEGRIRVVVGPRSALFAPVKNLGLIVLDEEHEESYKQEDPPPRYHAREVALFRAKQADAALMLVSATPSLESLHLVKSGQAIRLNLTSHFGYGWPQIRIVDRRRESANAPYIGKVLSEEIVNRSQQNEGIILLITRRGFAPVMLCKECGLKIECPNCAVSLTYHHEQEIRLRCHVCGYSHRAPDTCSSCGSENLMIYGAGTQRIEEEIIRRFPFLQPIRMDYDTTRKSGSHTRILQSFESGESQLLLGTQMVAKGHDFAHVTLVGVVNADTALFLPDFRSSERTFRLLVQASGRAGRGEHPGEVIVQTLVPDHPTFRSLIKPDVEEFLQNELHTRELFNYPPYANMGLITLAAEKNESAEKAAIECRSLFQQDQDKLLISGPTQALVARLKRRYRWRILLRTRREEDADGSILRSCIRRVRDQVTLPHDVIFRVDIDPLEVV